ncbi:MAG: hypothetical protein IJ688_03075 [Treponema sp.]|nr:hypothetical protein [Treponema sp.]
MKKNQRKVLKIIDVLFLCGIFLFSCSDYPNAVYEIKGAVIEEENKESSGGDGGAEYENDGGHLSEGEERSEPADAIESSSGSESDTGGEEPSGVEVEKSTESDNKSTGSNTDTSGDELAFGAEKEISNSDLSDDLEDSDGKNNLDDSNFDEPEIVIPPYEYPELPSYDENYEDESVTDNSQSGNSNNDSIQEDGDNTEYDFITSPEVSEREWSILVYMCADNNLEASAIEDLCEMEMSSLNTQQTSVLVLLDRSELYDTSNGNWSGAKLFKLKTGRSSSTQKIISEEIDCERLSLKKGSSIALDLSSGAVLESSLEFMKEEYPALHYGLVMWGHGTGWRSDVNEIYEENVYKGFAYDDSSKTYMTLKQLGKALQNSSAKAKLDFIGFDTCFGAEVEVLYELKNYTNYIVGSEGLLLYSGWNYRKFFDYFQASNQKSAEILCNCAVRQFSEQFQSSSRASISAIKTSAIGSLFSAFDSFMAMAGRYITNRTVRDEVMGLLYSNYNCDTERYCYGTANSDIYLDLRSAVTNLNYYFDSRSISLSRYYDAVMTSLSSAVVSSWASDRSDMNQNYMNNRSGIGFYFSTLGTNGLMLSIHPSYYIKNKTAEQISFVSDSIGYVPCSVTGSSLLDRLFYTSF